MKYEHSHTTFHTLQIWRTEVWSTNTHTQPSIHYKYERQRHEARTLTHDLPYTRNMKNRGMKHEHSHTTFHKLQRWSTEAWKLTHNLPHTVFHILRIWSSEVWSTNTHTQPSIHYKYEGQKHEVRTLTDNLPYTTNMKDRSMKTHTQPSIHNFPYTTDPVKQWSMGYEHSIWYNCVPSSEIYLEHNLGAHITIVPHLGQCRIPQCSLKTVRLSVSGFSKCS